MAVIVAVNSSSSVGGANNYIANSSKTTITTTAGEQKQLITGINCNPKTATQEMQMTKELFGKKGGRTYKHYIQSFHPDDPVTPELAHKISKEWIERNSKFEGYEILMATHHEETTKTGHIHNHFIVNSVNHRTGEKYHESAKELKELKKSSNELSKKYNLTVPEKTKSIVANDNQKYRAIERHYNPNDNYSSAIVETADAVLECKSQATSWDNFLQLMNQKNYNVKWKSPKTGKDYKYVTYTHPNGQKFRCKNLNNTFKIEVGKEQIINATSKQQQAREQQARIQEGSQSIDWGTIEHNINNGQDRVSEQSSDEVIGGIQQEIREIEERVARATGEEQPEDRPEVRGDRKTDGRNKEDDVSRTDESAGREREIEKSKRDIKPKPRDRGWEIER